MSYLSIDILMVNSQLRESLTLRIMRLSGPYSATHSIKKIHRKEHPSSLKQNLSMSLFNFSNKK